MSDLLQVSDLEKAKLHDTFHSEVITGKSGGVAGGSDIDLSTNQVTGQVQATLPKILSQVGFTPALFDFITGGTLSIADRNKAIFYETDGNWYSWGGTLPKTIATASSPNTTGGIAVDAWNVSTSAFMYRDWRGFSEALYAGAGIVDNGLPDTATDSQRLEALFLVCGANGTMSTLAAGLYPVGTKVRLAERDGSYWTVTAGGVVNGGNVLPAGPGNTAVLDITDNTTDAAAWGVVTGSDTTATAALFLDYIFKNKIKGTIPAGQYDVSGPLVDTADSTKALLSCTNGEAVFNYTGAELGTLISATNCDAVQIRGVTFNANDLISTPLDLRKSSTVSSGAILMGVRSFNCKQTTEMINPAGLRLIGLYANVKFLDCEVDGVSRVDPARACAGIALSGFSGIAEFSGCKVDNISTPDDKDADGIVVLGVDVLTATTYLEARAEIRNCSISNCQGRLIKLQISHYEVHGNTFTMSDGSSTITNWQAIDGQSNNGNVHDNEYIFGTGMTWGTQATLFSFQNIRNDGNAKGSVAYNNHVSLLTPGLRRIASLKANYGRSSFSILGTKVQGHPVLEGFQFKAVGGAGGIEYVAITYEDNQVQDYASQDLMQIFDLVDYGAKLSVSIRNNKVVNDSSISRILASVGLLAMDGNFVIANNENTVDRVDWPFDMNKLSKGNKFFTGSQAVANKGTGMTTFFHVDTDGFVQRNINTAGTTEVRRTSLNGTTWNAWV